MARQAEEERTYPANINRIADICRSIESAGIDMAFKSENPAEDGVWFRYHHKATFKSYGERITVTLSPLPDGTRVHIHSECGMPTQLMDGGVNKKNVAGVFDFIERGLSAQDFVQPAPMPAMPPQPQPVFQETLSPEPAPVFQDFPPEPSPAMEIPEPVQPSAPAFKFCKYCGKKLSADARFCSGCGAKL